MGRELRHRTPFLVSFLLTVLALAAVPPHVYAQPDMVVASEYLDVISRVDQGAGTTEPIMSGLEEPPDLTIDEEAQRVYWANGDAVWTAPFGSASAQRLTSGYNRIDALVLDAEAGTLYFSADGTIYRIGTDGSDLQALIDATARGFALDTEAGRLYWTGPTAIHRANLDGTNQDQLIEADDAFPSGIALDLTSDMIYWAERDGFGCKGQILRAPLAGGTVEQLLDRSQVCKPQRLALDVEAGLMYWTDPRYGGSGARTLVRATLDGADIDTLLDGANLGADYQGLVLDPAQQILYTLDEDADDVLRVGLGGASVDTLISVGPKNPADLAYDARTETLYWTSVRDSVVRLRRADIDGANVETLHQQAGLAALGLELDATTDRLYWTFTGTDEDGAIQRATLDGTSVETVLPGLLEPRELALDPENNVMFWTETPPDAPFSFSSIVRRADLEGDNLFELDAADYAHALAVDPASEQLYWIYSFSADHDQIRRSRYDGSSAETVVSESDVNTNNTGPLAIDAENGWLYWVDEVHRTPLVRRADLSGSAVEPAAPVGTLYPASDLVLVGSMSTAADNVAPAAHYTLSEPYPNPAATQAAVTLELRRPQNVRIEVYDVLGRRVATLHEGLLRSDATHRFTINAHGLSSGAYLIRAAGEDFTASRQLLLVR